MLITLPMFGDYYTTNIVSGAPSTSMIGNQIDLYFHGGPQPTIGAAITGPARVFLMILMSYYMWTDPPSLEGDPGVSQTVARGVRARVRLRAFQRLRGRLGNPWGKPRFLVLITWGYIAWAIVPVLIAIQFSFNDSRSLSVWHGFTMKWYTSTDPSIDSVFHSDHAARRARTEPEARGAGRADRDADRRLPGTRPGPLARSRLGRLELPDAVPAGHARDRGRACRCCILFSQLLRFVPFGTVAQLLGHITFSISYVVVIVRGRLFSIGPSYEEAAADLGAAPASALYRVLLPLLMPAIVASAAIVFAISIDDFVISQWLSSGANSTTVPVQIYAATRATPLPSTDGIATVIMVDHAALGRRGRPGLPVLHPRRVRPRSRPSTTSPDSGSEAAGAFIRYERM